MCNRACCKGLNASNSARSFENPAPILQKAKVIGLLAKADSIIEYGPGNLRNAQFLQRAGFEVAVVELKETIERYKKKYISFSQKGGICEAWSSLGRTKKSARKYDHALITFVLETICDPALRLAVLAQCRARLKRTGSLILSARGHKDVLTASGSGVRCGDGYATPGKTFIRGFDLPELGALLRAGGFNTIEPLHKPGFSSPELIHVIAR